ncbi:MAG TPA: hypothetical protein VNO22_03260 [Planctomycetota bacterium]|nr:hypothetical protein [Planctomycetota bacterium]
MQYSSNGRISFTADRPSDEVLAQHVVKVGLVKDAQLKAALQAQAKRALKGTPVPLGQTLVEQGFLTAAQLENLEEKLQAQRDEAKRLGPYRILKKLGEGGMARSTSPRILPARRSR